MPQADIIDDPAAAPPPPSQPIINRGIGARALVPSAPSDAAPRMVNSIRPTDDLPGSQPTAPPDSFQPTVAQPPGRAQPQQPGPLTLPGRVAPVAPIPAVVSTGNRQQDAAARAQNVVARNAEAQENYQDRLARFNSAKMYDAQQSQLKQQQEQEAQTRFNAAQTYEGQQQERVAINREAENTLKRLHVATEVNPATGLIQPERDDKGIVQFRTGEGPIAVDKELHGAARDALGQDVYQSALNLKQLQQTSTAKQEELKDLNGQVDDLTARAGKTEGGFLGMGKTPTPDAVAAKAKLDEINPQIDALQQAGYGGATKKDGTFEDTPDVTEAKKAHVALTTDKKAWNEVAPKELGQLDDAINERKASILAAGGDPSQDRVLSVIEAKKNELGIANQTPEIAQAQAQVAPLQARSDKLMSRLEDLMGLDKNLTAPGGDPDARLGLLMPQIASLTDPAQKGRAQTVLNALQPILDQLRVSKATLQTATNARDAAQSAAQSAAQPKGPTSEQTRQAAESTLSGDVNAEKQLNLDPSYKAFKSDLLARVQSKEITPEQAGDENEAHVTQLAQLAAPAQVLHQAVADAKAGKKPYNIDPAGRVMFDPQKPADSLNAAVKDGIIDKNYAEQHRDEFQNVQDKFDALQKSAGSAQVLKAVMHGAGVGGAFLAGSVPGARAGAAIGAAVPGAGETGISEGVGAALGGLATGTIAAFTARKGLQKLGEYNDAVKSLNDSAELHPVADASGQLLAFGASAPRALTNLYRLGSIAGSEGGALAAANVVGKQVATGAAGGAAFEGVLRPAFDKARYTIADQFGIKHDEFQGPSASSLAQMVGLGMLTAGHSIAFKNYSGEDIASILMRGKVRVAAGLKPTDAMSVPDVVTAMNKLGVDVDSHGAQALSKPLTPLEAALHQHLSTKVAKMEASGDFEGATGVKFGGAEQAVVPTLGGKRDASLATSSIEATRGGGESSKPGGEPIRQLPAGAAPTPGAGPSEIVPTTPTAQSAALGAVDTTQHPDRIAAIGAQIAKYGATPALQTQRAQLTSEAQQSQGIHAASQEIDGLQPTEHITPEQVGPTQNALRGLVKIATGQPLEALTSAERAAVLAKGPDGIARVEMVKGPDGAKPVITDATLGRVSAIAPTTAQLLPASEHEQRQAILNPPGNETETKPSQSASASSSSSETSQKNSGNIPAEQPTFAVEVQNAKGETEVREVQAATAEEAHSQVAQTIPPGKGLIRDVTQISAPPHPSSVAAAQNPATFVDQAVQQVSEQAGRDLKPAEEKSVRDMLQVVAPHYERWQRAFDAVNVTLQKGGTAGAAYTPKGNSLTISLPDLARHLPLYEGKPKSAEALLTHEAAHAIIVSSGADVGAIFKASPQDLKDAMQSFYHTKNPSDYTYGQEMWAYRLAAKIELAQGRKIKVNGRFLPEQSSRKFLFANRKALAVILRYMRDTEGELRKAGQPEEVIGLWKKLDELFLDEAKEVDAHASGASEKGTIEKSGQTEVSTEGHPARGPPVAEQGGGKPAAVRAGATESVTGSGKGAAAVEKVPAGAVEPAAGEKLATEIKSKLASGLNLPSGAVGHASKITQNGRTVNVAFVAQDSSAARPSHDAQGRVTPGYDQSLQPRDRSLPQYRKQSQNIATNLDFAKSAFFPETTTPATTADLGAPVMTQGGDTLIGNGREIGIKSAYDQNLTAARKYKADFVRNAAAFGIDPEAVMGMKSPILKRVITDDLSKDDLVRLSQESNEGAAMASNATEVANRDASRLNPQLLSLFDPNYGLDSTKNLDFLRAYQRDVVQIGGTANEANLTGSELTSRIRRAVFSYAYGMDETGRAAMDRMAGDESDAGKTITNALLTVAPIMGRMRSDITAGALFPGFDISPSLTRAAQDLSNALQNRPKNQSSKAALEGLLGQGNLFATDPMDRAVLEFLVDNRGKRAAIEEGLSNYAESVYRLGSPQEGQLFGEQKPPTAQELWQRATTPEAVAPKTEERTLLAQQLNTALAAHPLISQPRPQTHEVDQRLQDAFGAQHSFNALGLPNHPRTLEAKNRHDLLQPTEDKTTATVHSDSRLAHLGIMKPGEYSRGQLHAAIFRHFLSGGTAESVGDQKLTSQEHPEIVFLGGGGGAGKTTILLRLQAEGVFDFKNRVLVNTDEIRSLLPEYQEINALGDARSSNVTQEESSTLAKKLLKLAEQRKYNITFDATMGNPDKSLPGIREAKALGYTPRFVGVTVDPYEAAVRSYLRAKETDRYVPDQTLFEAHKGFNKSTAAYVSEISAKNSQLFDNTPPLPTEISVDGTVSDAYKEVDARANLDPAAPTKAQLLESYGRRLERQGVKGDEMHARGVHEATTGTPGEAGQGNGPPGESRLSSQQLDLFGDAAPTAAKYAKTLPAAAKSSQPALKSEVSKDVPMLSDNEAALTELFSLANKPPKPDVKPPELMSPEEYQKHNQSAFSMPSNIEGYHIRAVQEALQNRKPVSAAAFEKYDRQLKSSPGYVKDGDRYVYKQAPAPPSEVPTLRPGENQGDLLSKQTEELKLVGQTGVDHGARQAETEKAAAESEAASAEQDRLQGQLAGVPAGSGEVAAPKPAVPAAELQPVPVGKVDSPAQGTLNAALDIKQRLWKQVQSLRDKVKNAGPQAGNLRLDLLNAESAHRGAVRSERGARSAIEKRANELGQTTQKAMEVLRSQPLSDDGEKIEKAAVKLPDGRVISDFGTHVDVLSNAFPETNPDDPKSVFYDPANEAGFVTTKGRFLDRESAFTLAKKYLSKLRSGSEEDATPWLETGELDNAIAALRSQPLVPDKAEHDRFTNGLPLAKQIANRYTNIRGVDASDVQQHAQLALARASKAFDPARGAFLPFARTAINNELRGLYRSQNRKPSETSLDETTGETGTTPKDQIAAPSDVRSDVQLAESHRVINAAVAELPARMQGAISGILDGNTLDAIGQSLGGISRQAVGRLATEAMRRLRGKLGEHGIKGTGDLLSQNLDIVDAHIADTLAAQASADPLQQLIDSMDADHLEQLFDKANAEERGSYVTGRPDLAMGAEGAAQRAVDQYYTDLWKPKTRAEMAKEGEQILAEQGAGFANEIARKWLNGDTLHNGETFAAKSLLSELSRDTGTPEGLQRMMATGFAYRNMRGQTGRDLGAGFDPHKTPEERNREFLTKIISTLPAPKEAEIQAEPDPAKKRSLLDAAMKERLGQLEKAFAYLSKGGLTLDDILNGSWELHGKGTKLIENEMAGFDVPHQQALKLAQTGTRTAKEIAKATGLTEGEVERVNDQMISSLRDKLRDKVKAGLTLEKIDMQGALLAQPTGAEPPALSDEAVNAELNRIIKGMGFVASKDLGKFKVVKSKRRKLFVPPKVPADVRTANEDAAVPYPEGQTAPYTGRVLGQPGLPLYQEMMVRKGADLSNSDDVVKIARVAQAANGNRADMIYEAWINSILSGPTTHIAYKMALAANSAFEFTIQRGAEALVNLLVRDPESATFKEFGYIRKAILPGIINGLSIGARQWNTESDIFQQEIMNSQVEMFDKGQVPATEDFHAPSISETPLTQFFGPSAGPLEKQFARLGKYNPVRGRVMRMPTRLLWFIDGFYKTANSQIGVGPIAYRMARREGLEGDALSKRVNELVATAGGPAWIKAADLAQWLALRQQVKTSEQGGNWIDNAVARVAAARNGSHLIGSQIPFVQLPYNFVKIGMGKAFSPVTTAVKIAAAAAKALPHPGYDPSSGFFKMKDGKPFIENYGGKAKLVRDVATSLIAATAASIIWNIAAGDGDDDKKWLLITGSTPATQLKKGVKELQQRAYGGSYVLRIGGRGGLYFNYGKYEPGATVLGTLTDAVINIKHLVRGELGPKEAMDAFAGYLIAQAEDKTFLRALANISRVMQGEMGITDFAAEMVVNGIVPNLVRQPLRNLDDYIPDYKHSSDMYRLFPTASNAQPKIDLYGKPVAKTGNWFTRMFTIASARPYPQLEKADALLLRWNNDHPRDAHAPSPPLTTYTGTGEGKEKTKQMTPEQSTKFLMAVGHRFEQTLRGQISQHQIDHPKEEDVKMIEKMHRDAVEQTKREMFPKGAAPAPKRTANIVRQWMQAA